MIIAEHGDGYPGASLAKKGLCELSHRNLAIATLITRLIVDTLMPGPGACEHENMTRQKGQILFADNIPEGCIVQESSDV